MVTSSTNNKIQKWPKRLLWNGCRSSQKILLSNSLIGVKQLGNYDQWILFLIYINYYLLTAWNSAKWLRGVINTTDCSFPNYALWFQVFTYPRVGILCPAIPEYGRCADMSFSLRIRLSRWLTHPWTSPGWRVHFIQVSKQQIHFTVNKKLCILYYMVVTSTYNIHGFFFRRNIERKNSLVSSVYWHKTLGSFLVPK